MDVKITAKHFDHEAWSAAHPGPTNPVSRVVEETREPFWSESSIHTTSELLDACAEGFLLFAPSRRTKARGVQKTHPLVHAVWGKPVTTHRAITYMLGEIQEINEVYQAHGDEIVDAASPERRELHDAIRHLVAAAVETESLVTIQATRSNFVLAHG